MRNTRISILAILAVSVTAGALWLTSEAVTPKKSTWNDARIEAEKGGYRLISTTDLWERYSQKPDSLILVDTRQEWEFKAGHIKGAVNFPMEPTGFARWKKKRDLGRFLGKDKDRFIVFYCAGLT